MFALPITLGCFGLILVLARLKVPLAAAIVVGTVAIGVAFGLRTQPVIASDLAWRVGGGLLFGAIQPDTIAMTAITLLLMVLSSLMQASGQFEEIVGLTKALLRRRSIAMAALPAMVGLLPMPGGALFSAPMVASAAGKSEVGGDVLSAINYWFRHIWEHWWPLYPGVILAVSLCKTSWAPFAGVMVVLGVTMAAAGLLLFRGVHADLHVKSDPPPPETKRRLLWALSSILMILVVWLPLKYGVAPFVLPHLPKALWSVADKYIPLALGLIAGIVWTIQIRRLSRKMVLSCLRQKRVYEMAIIVLSVMTFQYVLKTVGAATGMADELVLLHVPVLLVVAVLPFIAGMVTGLAVGFVGTSFPIVLASVWAMPDTGSILPYAMLAYAFGHLGQMCSPLHVCHVVSNQYFKTGFGPVYLRILPSVAVCALASVGYFFLLRLFM